MRYVRFGNHLTHITASSIAKQCDKVKSLRRLTILEQARIDPSVTVTHKAAALEVNELRLLVTDAAVSELL